jgi:glucose/arabinose dehydrogenase
MLQIEPPASDDSPPRAPRLRPPRGWAGRLTGLRRPAIRPGDWKGSVAETRRKSPVVSLGAPAAAALAALAAIVVVLVPPGTARGQELPDRFQENVVLSGLVQPSAVRFADDGRVFVAEKSGLVKVFSGLGDPTATVFADLRTQVHNFWDRGLLGMALDPDFPAEPYVYVLYTHDFDPANPGIFPRWGSPDATSDGCPTPPGPTGDGCVVNGRLSRLEALGDVMTGSEQVLLEGGWCQQYPSHTIGSIGFGADGALYVSAGDGASFNFADYGQDGSPLNPCGDPPAGAGGTQLPPTAEGGALRSQDLRTSSDPTTLDGSILRVDPETGAPFPGNPGSGDANARRVVAHGFRNPFRFTVRPGTSELWIGDVGWSNWEEINRLTDPAGAPVENFGWPCYEGTPRQGGYDGLNLSLCETLYAAGAGAVTAPHYAYSHSSKVVPGEGCPSGGSAISGLAFYEGGIYPPAYDGALFFSDHTRGCIWAMLEGPGGQPSPSNLLTLVDGAAGPVDLQIGPGGDLFYVDFNTGTVRRITYSPENQPPTAVATAGVTSGPAPLEVDFDGTGSSDPDPGDVLAYAWDLDGDGQFDDSTDPQPSFTYDAGTYQVRLRVTDPDEESDTSDPITISAGNTPPTVTIDAPAPSTTWTVEETITFGGHAVDPQDGELPGSSLDWELTLEHCPSLCHSHPLQGFPGVGGGSFAAPDHEYPSHLELSVTATDSDGLEDTAIVRLDPETVEVTLASAPLAGVTLTFNDASGASPLTRTVIVGSHNSIAAPPLASRGAARWWLMGWSDGGARAHDVVAPPSPTSYTATYRRLPESCRLASPHMVVGTGAGERLSGTAAADAIMALGGEDEAAGLAGGDCLVGGAGADALRGGRGDDVLRGDAGRDEVRCGPGIDRVVLGGGGRDDVARGCERVRR